MELKPHFMISESDGGLYDTRPEGWSRNPPLRPEFSRHFSRIETVAQFKATLRAGGFAWPGAYTLFLITSDGGALCFDCARKESRLIIDSIRGGHSDGWKVQGCAPADDVGAVSCDHCGQWISEEESDND
ncbi:hypothetical protein [Synechococcus virus S-ESS1]|uniref:Uncharacterized protein n=1 Tax=Synechococcus virus S-ESS1 TaxID=1964565 RepID=A0A1V0DX67_9CAUD|nr:DNA ligase [Synechococcus virus S-ESS1]ARB05743.1 hypothetical protein [Synechococcus virus S-ESS1]